MERIPQNIDDTPEEVKYTHHPQFKKLMEVASILEVSIGNKRNLDTGVTEAVVFFHYADGVTPDEILATASHEDPIEATQQAMLATIDILEARQEAQQKPTVH